MSNSTGDHYDYENLIDCMVDEDGDKNDPNNLFTCKDGQECCTVDLEPACCSSLDINEALKDQAKLWGPLLGIILALAILIWWCRSDESCCDVDKPWLVRCGCKKKPPDDEESPADTDSLASSQLSLRSSKSGTTLLAKDDGVVGHDASELELAADNLERALDEEEQEAGGDEEAPEDGLDDDDHEQEEDKQQEDQDDDDQKEDENDDEKQEAEPTEQDDEPAEQNEDGDDSGGGGASDE